MSDYGRKQRILVLHSDTMMLGALTGILKGDQTLEIYQARSVMEGIRLAQETTPDLIICHCPAMEDCIAFCRQIKSEREFSPPVFLLLSDRTETQDIGRGLEQGVDDYIEKSMCSQILLPKVRSLLHTRSLRGELGEKEKRLEEANELLKKNFNELTAILLKILEVRIPGASDRAEVAKKIAEFITHRLIIEDDKRKNVILASLLHEIGKVGLPDNIVGMHYNTMSAASISLFQQYTTVGSMVISTITGFKDAADAVYHQLENYDGTGFPDGLMGDEIPVAAKILRAIVFQEDLYTQGHSTEDMIDRIRVAMHTILDQKIANPLIEFLIEQKRKPDANKIKIPIDELMPGMVIAEDVYASSGIKLVPKGLKLQEKMLAVLMNRNREDPIIGGVYIVTG